MKKSFTTKEIVNILKTKGYNVEYVVRKQGGIQIRSIAKKEASKSYKGTAGNIAARKILNMPLSARQIEQREKAAITSIRRADVRQREKNPSALDPALKRIMRKLNQALKAKAAYTNIPQGRIRAKQISERLKSLGGTNNKNIEIVKSEMEEALQTTLDIAYSGKINAFYQTVKSDNQKYSIQITNEIEYLLSELSKGHGFLTEFEFNWISDVWYNWQAIVNNDYDDEETVTELAEVLELLKKAVNRSGIIYAG